MIKAITAQRSVGILTHVLGDEGLTVKCSKCADNGYAIYGHNRASTSCPFYDFKEPAADEAFRDGTVKQANAFKFTLNMEQVIAISPHWP